MQQNPWFSFAQDDLDSAYIMFREGKYNTVCFFAHQSAEKILKAFLS